MKINECKHSILTQNYPLIERYLSNLVSTLNVENDTDIQESLSYLYQENNSFLIDKLTVTFDLLEKLGKFKLLIKILKTNDIQNVDCEMILLKSLFELGYLEEYRLRLKKLTSYIINKKIWNKSTELQLIIDEELFRDEFNELKIQTLCLTGQFKDLIMFVSSLDLKTNSFESSVLSNLFKEDMPELISYKVSLLLQKNLKLDEKLKKLILFYDNELVVKSLELIKKSKLDYRIVKSIETEKQNLSSSVIKLQETNKSVTVNNVDYRSCNEEEKFLVRLKLEDPMFEYYNRDLAISFINLNMFKLVVEYLQKFDLDLDGIYLQLECLNLMGKYSRVIDIINSKNLDQNLAFRYLKAIAYNKMGVPKLAKAEFFKVAKEDSNFRNVKEYIK